MEPTNNSGRETADQGPAPNEGPATENNNRQLVECPRCRQPQPTEDFHAPGGTRSSVCRSCLERHASLDNMLEVARMVVARFQTQSADLYLAVGSAVESDYRRDVQALRQKLRPIRDFETTLESFANLYHVEASSLAHMPAPEQAPQAQQPAALPAAAPHQQCSKCRKLLSVDLFRSKTGKALKMCKWCRERDHRYQGERRDRKKDQGGGPSEGGPGPDTGICV